MIEKVCECCGAGFVAKRSWARFCCVRCKKLADYWKNPEKHRKSKRVVYADGVCPVCGVGFSRLRSTRITCSSTCSDKHRRDKNPEKHRAKLRAYYWQNPVAAAERKRAHRRSEGPEAFTVIVIAAMTKLKRETQHDQP
mgnify:FL=1